MDKKFIFKYEPQSSVKEIFTHLGESIKKGKKYIQPENISITNDLAVISRILSRTRLKLFSAIREKQPNSVHKLSQLLHRDYANVWRDCQVLAGCKIIELKKKDKEIRPIALYDQIVIAYPEKLNEHFQLKTNHDKELEQKFIANINWHHYQWLQPIIRK